ncbi:MAG TPA: ribose-5-phosphate isomerase RpiA [Aestuariivirga sp.]|nr:ribose-5-phosphate isomerase RpiA [Aestuariivirga sp.]
MKKAAAVEALKFVKPGMNIGLGTGSTANHFIEALAAKVREGLDIKGVATSKASGELAEKLGIPLTKLQLNPHLDLTVDGADEFDPQFRLIKGGGGALLREKIVASSSRFMVVVADESKQVKKLGKFPLPVEILVFGSKATIWKVERAFKILKLDAAINVRRTKDGELFTTENGNFILDCSIGVIPEPERLEVLLKSIPGVVETGLFIGICGIVLMGTPKGVTEFKRG